MMTPQSRHYRSPIMDVEVAKRALSQSQETEKVEETAQVHFFRLRLDRAGNFPRLPAEPYAIKLHRHFQPLKRLQCLI